MDDPQYPVGARVRWQGRSAVVKSHGMLCAGDSIYRFLGYELLFSDGSFSGWHPEDTIEPEEQV